MNLYTQIRNGSYAWKIQVRSGCDPQSLIYKGHNDILPSAAILFE